MQHLYITQAFFLQSNLPLKQPPNAKCKGLVVAYGKWSLTYNVWESDHKGEIF